MAETFTPAGPLFVSDIPKKTKLVTILSGVGAIVAGTVLGKITKGAVTAAAAGAGTDGANTGDGTCTPDATSPLLANAQPGVYRVKFTEATKAGVYDPKGNYLGEAATGATFANQIKFALAAGTTPHIAGDGWAITVAAGSGKFKVVNSANVDGSENPYAVLAEDVDATSADKVVTGYLSGDFNEAKLVFGGSDTIATHEDKLRALGIFTGVTIE